MNDCRKIPITLINRWMVSGFAAYRFILSARRNPVAFWTWWIIFGSPLLVLAVAWVGLCMAWKTEPRRTFVTLAMFCPTTATLLACGGLVYVQRGGMLAHGAVLEFNGYGFFLAITGAILSFLTSERFGRWFSALGFGVSVWVMVWFGLMASAAD